MAVVTTKSAAITNRDASPTVLSNSAVVNSRLKRAMGMAAIASGDSVASRYVLCSIPSNAVVTSAMLSCPAIGSTTAADFGLYDTTAAGGAAVSSQFFKAAVNIHSAALQKAEQIQGNIVTVANSEQRVWQQLGLASDPGKMYDVCLTLSGAADGAGSVLAEIQFAD